MKTKIKEIFTSIQGEGPYVGYKQLFIRFCFCNLKCRYCDTDFDSKNSPEYSVDDLIKICNQNLDCHSISLTGGEPLMNTEFLLGFLPQAPLDIYLETNGTMYYELEKIIDYVSYISADIKLPSCTGMPPLWNEHEKFLDIASRKDTFVKAVFDSSLTDLEIAQTVKLCKKYDIELILQPKMNSKEISISPEFITKTLDKFLKFYPKCRVIPQTHKFIDII